MKIKNQENNVEFQKVIDYLMDKGVPMILDTTDPLNEMWFQTKLIKDGRYWRTAGSRKIISKKYAMTALKHDIAYIGGIVA